MNRTGFMTCKPDNVWIRVLSAPMEIVEGRSSRAFTPTLLNTISVLLGMAIALSSASSAAAARTDRWEIAPDGTFVCKLDGNDPASDMIDVTNMKQIKEPGSTFTIVFPASTP